MGKIREYLISKIKLTKQLKKYEEKIYWLEDQNRIKELAIKELENERDNFHFENLSLKNELDKQKVKFKNVKNQLKEYEKVK